MTTAEWTIPRAGSRSGAPAHAAKHTRPRVRSRSLAPARTRADLIMLAGLLVSATFIFFWNLTASGYANEFYSAAAQAASQSWEAFLWGSLDAGNAITVDKPPAAIWFMGLSVRIFGLSSFAILLPQALMGVGSTYVIYATTRRYWGNRTGILAGGLFLLIPVAALMFRFNNPDALLVLLMLGASASTLRALELAPDKAGNRRRTLWIALAGSLVGLGFLTKQFQVMLIVPGLAAALLVASPSRWPRRLLDAFVEIASIVVSAGWWVLLTVIVPASERPYIGGSQTNSFIELTFSYNGLGRLTGDETGSVVPGATGTAQGGMWGETGIGRLFTSDFGDQITWFAFLAFAGIVVGVLAARALRRRALAAQASGGTNLELASGQVMSTTEVLDLARLRQAFMIIFAAWLVVTWLVFSFMAGIFHSYYTVALAPAVAMLAAAFLVGAWELRDRIGIRALVVAVGAASSVWAFALILRSGSYTWLGWAVLVVGLGGALAGGISLLGALRTDSSPARVTAGTWVALGAMAVAIAAGPTVWTAATIATGHNGSIVSAGPSGSMGGMGGGQGGQPPTGGGTGAPGTTTTDGTSTTDGSSTTDGTSSATTDGSTTTDGTASNTGGPSQGGGLLGGGSASEAIVEMLIQNASGYRWAAATTGSQNAASYQLASELPVMAIGGFNGSDPAPTLEEFKSYVAQGLIRYYISGGGMGGSQMGGSDAASEIAEWVAENFTATTVDGVTIYDLSSGATS